MVSEGFPADSTWRWSTSAPRFFARGADTPTPWRPVLDTRRDTIYDLASLSKVVSTTTLALWLVQEQRWRLSDPALEVAPGPRTRRPHAQRRAHPHVGARRPSCPSFTSVVDRRRSSRRLWPRRSTADHAVTFSTATSTSCCWAGRSNVAPQRPSTDSLHRRSPHPWAMRATRYRPPARLRQRVAATELNGDQRYEPELVWGQVHDGNAWALGWRCGTRRTLRAHRRPRPLRPGPARRSGTADPSHAQRLVDLSTPHRRSRPRCGAWAGASIRARGGRGRRTRCGTPASPAPRSSSRRPPIWESSS